MRLFRPNVQKLFEKKDVDGLVKALTDRETEIRLAAAQILGVMRAVRAVLQLITALKDEEAEVREAAAESLGMLGDARAVEPLVALVRDPAEAVQKAAAEALLKFGAPAVRSLCNTLTNPQPQVRLVAVQTLGAIGDPQAVKPLCQLLSDPDAGVRQAVAIALGKLGPTALEFLCKALRDKDVEVREAVADAIEQIGVPNDPTVQAWYWTIRYQWAHIVPLGAVAVEPLCLNLTHPAMDVRKNVAKALGEIGDQRATGPLLNCLRDPEWEVREAASFAVGLLHDTRAVKPLIGALTDRDPGLREAAAKALGGIGDVSAVEGLVGALRDDEWAVSQAASDALGAIGPSAIEPLINVIRGSNTGIRKLAAETLEKVGVPDDPAVQAWFAVMKGNWEWARSYGELAVDPCIAALQDDDHRTRKAAAELLGDLRDRRSVIPLCAALKDRRPDVRATIIEVLGRMGQVVVDPLIEALNEQDWALRQAAVRVLGQTNDERAVFPLSEVLHDEDSRVREAAAESLDKLGFPLDLFSEYWYVVAKKDWKRAVSLGDNVLGPLVNALHDPEGEVRQEAARALGMIGDPSVIDELRPLLTDEEWYVRDTAISALEKLGVIVEEEPLAGGETPVEGETAEEEEAKA